MCYASRTMVFISPSLSFVPTLATPSLTFTSLPFMGSSDPLNVTDSSHREERQLFARLVFSLGTEPSLSMEIIAFWCWLEGNGHANFLQRINSFEDKCLLAIVDSGKKFIEALHHEPDESNARSIPFRQEAVEGIAFYLNDVCYRALDDLRGKAEMQSRTLKMKELVHQIGQAYQDYMKDKAQKDLRFKLMKASSTQTYKHYGEGTSSRELLDTMVLRQQQNDGLLPQGCLNVPHDERTLFVTFSNGYPLTKEELYDFFMSHFGDVEEICIEEPAEPRPPLYAHVSFFSQETLFHVLDGNKRVKFMTKGKHLWARQFVPKRKNKA